MNPDHHASRRASCAPYAAGLQYKDVIVGDGAQPSPGFQVGHRSEPA